MPNREILASPDIAESEEGAVLLNLSLIHI